MNDTKAQLEKLENQIRVLENRERMLISKKKDILRRKRTHYLCQIGGLVLSILGDDIDQEKLTKLLKENKHLFTPDYHKK